MKIVTVACNNHKHAFVLRTRSGEFIFPYSQAEVVPAVGDPVQDIWIDAELGGEAFTYRLASGKEGSVHVEQVLEYNRDPEYMRRHLLYNLTIAAQRLVAESPLTKREVVRRLGTSPTQLYRLLDQTNYNKSVDKMLALLDCEVEFIVRATNAKGGGSRLAS